MEILYIRKWNFIAPRLNNFREELSKLKKKKKKKHSKKISCISGNGTFYPQA